MINHNLKEIVNFSKSNNNFSDFDIVNNFKLKFTKYKSINSKKQFGGYFNQQQMMMQDPSQQQQQQQQQMMMQDPLQQQQMMMQDPLQQQMMMQDPSKMQKKSTEIPVEDSVVNDLQMLPDTFLDKPSFVTDSIKTYTIPEGTILYYSSDKRGFNTNSLQLHGSGYVNNSSEHISFFTPNFRLASDKIQGCSIDRQKGYIHTFRVIREIPDIFIKLPYDTNEDISLPDLHKDFCEGSTKYTGVGFFYPKNEIDLFNNNINTDNNAEMDIDIDNGEFYSEFYLCNPRPYLEYIYSQKCASLRKLTDPYKFNN